MSNEVRKYAAAIILITTGGHNTVNYLLARMQVEQYVYLQKLLILLIVDTRIFSCIALVVSKGVKITIQEVLSHVDCTY